MDIPKYAKVLFARIFKVEFMVLSCRDVTEEFYHKENERIYRVEYHKRGKPYVRYISFSGEYSPNPEIRALQKYCVESVKHA